MCVSAAEGGCIELMTEYLLQVQQGNQTAEAQQQLFTERLHYEGTSYADWYGATLEWARAQGCTAPLVYADDDYSDEEYYSDDDNSYDDDAYDDFEGSDYGM
eukprot:1464-Heterococcus_DN1.PRE.3